MLRLSLSSVFPFLPHLLCNQSVISSFATFLRSFTRAQHFTILHLTSRIYFLTCHPVSIPPTHFICEFWNTALLRTFKDLLKPLFWHWRPPKWVLLLSSPSPSPSISKVVHSFLPNCHVHIFFAHILLHLLMCSTASHSVVWSGNKGDILDSNFTSYPRTILLSVLRFWFLFPWRLLLHSSAIVFF